MSTQVPVPAQSRFAFGSWAVYDFANSLYGINVFGLYFILWLTEERGAPLLLYSVAYAGVMLLVAVTAPFLGAISDRSGRRLPFLLVFTALAIAPVLILSKFSSITLIIVLFGIAQYFYQGALVFYNALMVDVADGKRQGLASGVGMAANYLGNVLGILFIKSFVDRGGRSASFLPSALFFLVFAVPCFFFVRDMRKSEWKWGYVREAYQQFAGTIREARRYRQALLFLVAFFLYEDAIATLMHFPTVYLSKVAGFSTLQLQLVYMLATGLGVPGALFAGWLADRIGPKKTVLLSVGQWILIFVLWATLSSVTAFFALAVLLGINLGWTGAASRVMLVKLVPAEKIGEFFGLFAVGQRFGAVIGPLIWGLTISALADRGALAYRGASVALMLTLTVGFFLMLRVKEPKPGAEPEVAALAATAG